MSERDSLAQPAMCRHLGTPLATNVGRAGGPTDAQRAVLLGGFAGTWLPAEGMRVPLTRHDLALSAATPVRACSSHSRARPVGSARCPVYSPTWRPTAPTSAVADTSGCAPWPRTSPRRPPD